MLNVSRLLSGRPEPGDALRYHPGVQGAREGTGQGWGPVVVWNCTPACNLRCAHCYYEAGPGRHPAGLSTEEALAFVDDLAAFRVPVLLFSGGEPLLRSDLSVLVARAVERGIRTVISTNGTLITRAMAARLRDLGVSYVGVSLDGGPETNDRLRGMPGAFGAALAGIRNCLQVGQRVGLRFTINGDNRAELEPILDLIETEGIPRACFYHLVCTGRGADMVSRNLPPAETRQAVETIFWRALRLGSRVELLTVDNHADAPYLYLWARRHLPERAEGILRLLEVNGGNRSGIAIAGVDHEGFVYPDQFTRRHPVGNIQERPFSAIWSGGHPLLAALRDRKRLLPLRCRACRWLSLCNGNFRARAEAAAGDFWAMDSSCYLTDEEIAVDTEAPDGGSDGWVEN